MGLEPISEFQKTKNQSNLLSTLINVRILVNTIISREKKSKLSVIQGTLNSSNFLRWTKHLYSRKNSISAYQSNSLIFFISIFIR